MDVQGADRQVEWHEVQRFSVVALEVTFYAPPATTVGSAASEGAAAEGERVAAERGPLTTHVMYVDDILGTEKVVWKLADVNANSPGARRAHGESAMRW